MHIDAVEYVASDANLSDEPSRLKLDTLERMGATQVSFVVPDLSD